MLSVNGSIAVYNLIWYTLYHSQNAITLASGPNKIVVIIKSNTRRSQ